MGADEDHIRLQTEESRIVPLVSVYEGIEKNGKRGVPHILPLTPTGSCATNFALQKVLQQLDTVPKKKRLDMV